MAIRSLKINEYYQTPLFSMYHYTMECSHLNDEELKEDFCSAFIPFIHTLPKVTNTLRYKGNLRISWSFDMQYNKNIDLIFFPEENPYINYAVLFAKDFEKSIDKEEAYYKNKKLSAITIPYNINYDFVKTILSQSTLSKSQQERFFQVRFGSVFIPMEIEFEWYSVYWSYYDEPNSIEKTILFPRYDKYLNGILEGGESLNLCLGIIQSYQVLSTNTPLNFSPYIAYWKEEENKYGIYKKISYSEIFTPLPTAALAITQTNIGDYLVNVRDKPHSKEGKIIAQLLTQETKIPPNFCLDYGDHGCYEVNPLYREMDYQGYIWAKEDNNTSGGGFLYYHYKTKQTYYKKEKSKLINPLNFNAYLVLVWNIDSNNWAKVWVLRTPDKKSVNEDGVTFEVRLSETYNIAAIVKEVISSYSQTFLKSPSTLKLYEGYIHCSGLRYLAPFSENYIKR